MRIWNYFFPLVVAGLLLSCDTKDNIPERPNIIIIMADDMGYEDAGCYGSRDIPTPGIDQLAAEGIRFTSGYVMMPYCGPSRAGLITGQYPMSFGFQKNPTPIFATDQGLPPGCTTIAEHMQAQGYVTGGVGKWHLGTTPDRHPNAMGFTYWYGFLGGAHYYFPMDSYGDRFTGMKRPWHEGIVNQTLPLVENSRQVKYEDYMTHVFSEKSVEFIKANKDHPFFLYVSYNAPHTPLEAPREAIAEFPEDKVTHYEGIDPVNRGIYAAMISEMDKGIVQIMATLEEQGLLENTMVWFLSDNGGVGASSNYPLRAGKGHVYEGGIRVPFIVRWPRKIKGGQVLDQPVTAMDIGATSIALGGLDLTGLDLHGKDLMPLLLGETHDAPHETLFWKHGYGQQGPLGAIRKGDYKLVIQRSTPAKIELYNLVNDISEQNDLSQSENSLAESLYTDWKRWEAGHPEALWEMPPSKEWPKYQYATYEWLKGSPQYTADPDSAAL